MTHKEEEIAKMIYEVMPYNESGVKPDWVENGNSLMQGEARNAARKICTTLLSSLLTKEDEKNLEHTKKCLADGYIKKVFIATKKGRMLAAQVQTVQCY